MDNIFENAYFGKAYKTSDGRMAIYLRMFICNGYMYYFSTGDFEFSVNESGKIDRNIYPFGEDIVSEWQEPINEEELDKLSIKEAIKDLDKIATGYVLTKEQREYIEQFIVEGYRYGYVVGYRKAMEE